MTDPGIPLPTLVHRSENYATYIVQSNSPSATMAFENGRMFHRLWGLPAAGNGTPTASFVAVKCLPRAQECHR
jgi:hypothetical protein